MAKGMGDMMKQVAKMQRKIVSFRIQRGSKISQIFATIKADMGTTG